MKFHRRSKPSRKNSRRAKKQTARARLHLPGSLSRLSILRHELLEDRRMLAVISDGGTNTLAIHLEAGEQLGVLSNGGTYTFSSNDTFTTSSGSDPASQATDFTGIGTSSLTLTAAGITQYTGAIDIVDSGGTGASVDFNDSGADAYDSNFDVELHNSPALAGLTFNGTSSFGSNNLTANVDTRIIVNGGAELSTTSGSITLDANQQATATSGNFVGIDVNDAGITTSTGTITLAGKGGNSGSNNYGVEFRGAGGVGAFGASPGLISITGAPGDGASAGINFDNGEVVSSGSVTLTGSGGSITEQQPSGGADVTGATVTLVTTGSQNDIGTPAPAGGTSTPLKVNASLLNATTNDGFIVTANTTGNMPLGVLNAGGAMIELTAVGAITDGNGGSGSPNLSADGGAILTTTGSNSAIGTAALPVRTAIGALTATTNDGGVYISDSHTSGLIVSSIVAQEGGNTPVLNTHNRVVVGGNPGTDNVSITATGPIVLASAQGVSTTIVAPNLVSLLTTDGDIMEGEQGSNNFLAQSVSLGASGEIGDSNSMLGLSVQNISAVTINGGIFLSELIPGTVASVVAGGAGSDVSVTGNGATLAIGNVTAPGTVTLDETGGALVSGTSMNVTGQTVNLTAKSGIGGSSSPFTITTANLTATADTSGAGIFVKDKAGLSTVSAATNAGDVAISDSAGGSINFKESTDLLNTSGTVTVSFDNTGGNVALGAVNATSITASGAITADSTVDLTGDTVALAAGTGIGATGSPIKMSVNALNATTTSGDIVVQNDKTLIVNATTQTGSDINVTTKAGDMTVGAVSALGTITLDAFGAVLAGNGNPFNVSANTLILAASNGIGTSAAALTTSVSTLTADGGAGGGLFLSNSGTLSITSATATGGALSITTLGGLDIGTLNAVGQAVTLSATGALTDTNGETVTADSAMLNALAIGSSSAPLDTDLSSLTATATDGGIDISDSNTGTITLTATASGPGSNINVTSQGNIDLMAVTAKGNSVTLEAPNGSITNGLTSSGVNITAQDLSITASGGIGTSANPLEILVAQIDTADGGAPGVFMDNAGPEAITASALEASGTGTLSFDAASLTILDMGSTTATVASGRSLLLKTGSGPIVFLNQADTIETSGGGSITVEAGTTPGSGGVAVLGNLTTDGGSITITADYNITIGLINAGTGNVTVQSANGILLDGNGASTLNIIAGTTTLSGNGPTARQLELDEETKIAAAAAASAEASADQSNAEAFSSGLSSIAATVATDHATVNSDQPVYDSAKDAVEKEESTINTDRTALIAVDGTHAAAQVVASVAKVLAAAAIQIPIVGTVSDEAAEDLQAVADGLGIAVDVADAVLSSAEITLTNLEATASKAESDLTGAEATLAADEAAENALQAAVAIAQAAAANALLLSETAAVVRNQAIAARDQANVIGSPTDPLGLQVPGPVNVTAGPTDSYLQVSGNTALDQIAATGSVTLISTGAITNGAPAGTPNILATGLTIVAVNGIGSAADPLLTRVGTLNATNTTTGDIDISNTAGTPAALDITGISNTSGGDVVISNSGNAALGEGITVTGPISLTGAGTDHLTINSGSPLTISANITSAGPIIETAAATSPPFDDLTVEPGVTIQSTGSSVSLSAGNNINVEPGSTIEAATAINITGGAATSNVVVEGTLVGTVANVGVDAATNNNNSFTITPSATTPITVAGGTAAGSNTLNFNADGLPVTILNNTITAAGKQPVTFNDFAAVKLLNPAGGGSVILDGTPSVANNMVLTGTGQGAGTFTLNGGTPISFSGVTSFTFDGADLNDQSTVTPFATPTQSWNVALTIDGGAGVNTTTFDGVAGISENMVVQPSAPGAGQIIDNNEATGTPIAVVNYIDNTEIIVNASSAAGTGGDTDSLTLKGTDPGSAGTSGNDTFTANFAAPGTAAAPNVTVADSVSGKTLYNLDDLSNFNTLNVAMGAGDDTFDLVNAGKTLNYIIDGGSGSNTLNAQGTGTFSVYPGASSDAGSLSTPTNNGNSLTNVSFTGIQAINLTGTGTHDNLQVFGTGGNDVFTQEETGVTVNGGPSIGFNPYNYPTNPGAGFTTVSLNGGGGKDRYDVNPSAVGPDPSVIAASGATLNVVSDVLASGSTMSVSAAGQKDTLTVIPTAAGNGYVSDNTTANQLGLVNYSGIAGIDLVGAPGDSDTAGVAGTKGDDSLTYSPGADGGSGAITGMLDAANATGFGPFALPGVSFSQMSPTGPVGLFATPALSPLPSPAPNITGGTDTAVINGTAGGDKFTAGPAAAGVNLNNVVVATGAAADLVLHGLGGNDRFNLTGALPYTNTTIDDGSIVNLTGATGPVTINEGDNTVPSNTTITGYGGTVTLIGVDTANVNAGGNSTSAVGTSQNDNFIYTPTAAAAGTFYDNIASGNNLVPNTVFNLSNVSGDFTVFGGSGGNADEVTLQATDARDLIEINQGPAIATVLANNVTALLPVQLATNVQNLNALGEGGQNTFQVIPAAGLGGSPDNLLININGGSGSGANNALVLANSFGNTPATLPATSFVVDNRGQDLNSGTIRLFQSAVADPDINFTNVQIVSPIVATSGTPNGNLMIMGPDKNEPNDTQATATSLGSAGNIEVSNATVFASSFEFPGVPADQDYYSVTAQQTGTLDFVATFNLYNTALLPGGGQLNMQVLDATGNVIANAAGGAATFGAEGAAANDRIRIPVVAGQTYFVHVFGANANGSPNANVVNGYNLSIVNTPAIVPFNLELSRSVPAADAGRPDTGDLPINAPADDTGRSQFDNVTNDSMPRIYLRLSDGVFLNDLPGNGTAGNPPVGVIPIPFSLNATTAGFRVAIFDGNNTQTPVGFAKQVAGVPGLYEYDFTTPLADGVHNLTAEVQMVDPAAVHETGFGGTSATFSFTVDTTPPPVSFGAPSVPNSGLDGTSDSGVQGQPATLADRITNVSTPTFYGVAEADSIVRLYVQTPTGNVLVGQTQAMPTDGTNADPNAQWRITSNIDLNNPSLGLPLDGVRNMFVTAEDLAGNVSTHQELTIFVDTQGPTVNKIGITGAPSFPLFNTKTTPTTVASPTPLVGSLDVTFNDLPVRVGPSFVYPAVDPILATTTSNYALVGENNGIIPITSVTLVDNTASGTPGTTTVTLHFSAADTPLPDDRYTLTISDKITDNAGNPLQGNFNGTSFPSGLTSGNGSQGQTFVGAFTVNSRAHIGNYSSGTVDLDINGNGVFDPQNPDANNRDAILTMGYPTDRLFSGNFSTSYGGAPVPGTANGFEKLAAYGQDTNGNFRWLYDLSGSGGAATTVPEPFPIDGLPVAGNFAGSPLVAGSNPPVTTLGDQVGLFDGEDWYLDVLDQGYISAADLNAPATATHPAGVLRSDMTGLPFVGNFDGYTDLGTYQNGVVQFDLASLDPGHILTGQWNAEVSLTSLFSSIPFNYVTARPVAGYLNGLGQESSLGFYVPGGTANNPGTADWYFLEPTNSTLSGALPIPAAGLFTSGTVTAATPADQTALSAGSYFFNIIHAFKDQPLGGSDLLYQFGDQYALPVVGLWDPPADGLTSGSTPSPTVAGTYVTNLYTQILGRQPSASDVAYWVNQLESGETPAQLTQSFVTSNEYRANQINQLYEQYLGRPADAGGITYWTNIWNSTGGPEHVQAGIIGSPEYFATAQKLYPGLSADAAWITALYHNILNRAVDTAGLNYWVNYLQTNSPQSVVLGFVTSDEYRLDLIAGEFRTYLGRAVDQASAQALLEQMQTGLTQDALLTLIASSDEYINKP